MHPLRLIPALLLLLVAAACGGSAPSTAPSADPNAPRIAARNLEFDRSELAVPAGRAFQLVFDNQESAPHNVAIYTDQSATSALFQGEVFAGPSSRTYDVPSLAAGSYYFRCDLHPNMDGTITAQ